MKEKYTWKTKYVWYVVTDEGRMVHPGDSGADWVKFSVLSWSFDTEEDAIAALHQFYKDDNYLSEHHILQKVYVKTSD